MAIKTTTGISVGDIFTTNGKDIWDVEKVKSNPTISLRNRRTGQFLEDIEAGHEVLDEFMPVIKHPGTGAVPPLPSGVEEKIPVDPGAQGVGHGNGNNN